MTESLGPIDVRKVPESQIMQKRGNMLHSERDCLEIPENQWQTRSL
jgi:hypothetical protein